MYIRPTSKKIFAAVHIQHQLFLHRHKFLLSVHTAEPSSCMLVNLTEMVLALVRLSAFPVDGYSSVSGGLPGGEETGLHEGLDDAWPALGPREGSSAMLLCVASLHVEALRFRGSRAASLCTNSFYF